MTDLDTYRDRLAVSFLEVIDADKIGRCDGRLAASGPYVSAMCGALVLIAAVLLADTPGCQTSQGMRDASEAIGADVLSRLIEMRDRQAVPDHTAPDLQA